MFLLATIDDALTAEFELNFATKTWSLSPAQAKWGDVMFSDRGSFQVKDPAIWLMDGLGNVKDSAVILHDAPTGEEDEKHRAGTGRAYAPARAKYRDATIHWRFLRKSTPTGLTASRNTGVLTPVRLRAKAICQEILPPQGLSNGKRPVGKDGNPVSGTGCGEFPGRVMGRMLRKDVKPFSITVTGVGPLTLTSPTIEWERLAKAIDDKYQPAKKCWVEFTGSNRPQTGDIYLLAQWEKKSEFQHVGMIISSEGADWMTADGGQGSKADYGDDGGWKSGFIPRKFYPTGQIDGEYGSKAWLKGWVDLDNLRECLADYFPKELAGPGG
jgi:hypothetical protein